MAWLGTLAVGAAAEGLYALGRGAVNYGGAVIGGHWGYQVLQNTVSNCGSAGSAVAGPVGEIIGRNVGKVVAGGALNQVASEAQTVANAVGTIGNTGIDLIRAHNGNRKAVRLELPGENDEPPVILEGVQENQTDWSNVAWQTAKAVGVLGAAAGVVFSGGGVIAPLALAAAAAIPDTIEEFNKPAVQADQVDFVDDVVKPAAKDLAFGAAGKVAGNLARFNVVETAFNNRVKLGEKVGGAVGGILPNFAQGACETVGKGVGYVDAGRVAMCAATLEKAEKVGSATQAVVTNGLQITDAIVNNQVNKPVENTGWAETARKAAWVTGGIVAGAALTCLAPEAALVTGGAAAISALPALVKWGKAKLLSRSEESEDETVKGEEIGEIVITDDTTNEMLESKDKIEALSVRDILAKDQTYVQDMERSWVMMNSSAAHAA